MASITALLVAVSFAAGCATLVVGYRLGHGEASLLSHLNWAMGTLLLQFAAVCVATVHARAESRQWRALEMELEAARSKEDSAGKA